MKIKAFSKINLGLEVLKKRDDGYHDIRTLFQSISLHDLLDFEISSSGLIRIKGSDPTISWGEDNLVYRAAYIMKQQSTTNKKIEISVEKKIPAGAGLGGGSSDAAVTLLVLNKLLGLNLRKEELMEFGRGLGADVPYFLQGGLCIGTGKGDQISLADEISKHFCVLVQEGTPVSTESVYKSFFRSLTSRDKDSKIIEFLNTRSLGELENDLEETVFKLHPQIKEVKSLVRETDPVLTLVSGTGSVVFGIFRKKDKAKAALENIKKVYPAVFAETLNREEYWSRLMHGV
ncbi:MAG: 4-(cytidine 5'-diphospho)-2-C-methyl-D-erythritol kinase [Candidatus Aminicenantes bacterium]|nr:4-(cytidine 5'-diphospho)-2-C-methyl-D-erythritol kinase [Candidatus Aminicenantes bacterium]